MDRAVIVGTLEFLGFYFCKKILEEGIEVEGIHLDLEKNKVLIEEKRLEIGRNANYNEWSMDNELQTLNTRNTTLIVDFYDLFMWERETTLFENGIKKLLDGYEEEDIIFLLPISLKSNLRFGDVHAKLHKLILGLKKKGNVVQSFFLPTINGTWLSEGIDTRDSFYMEDVVDAILDLILRNKAL